MINASQESNYFQFLLLMKLRPYLGIILLMIEPANHTKDVFHRHSNCPKRQVIAVFGVFLAFFFSPALCLP